MSQAELLENVKTWLDIDNQIRALQKEIRERRKMKKDLTENLVGIMKTQDIDALNVPDGQLIYNKTKTKSALSKKHLLTSLANYFKNDRRMVDELTKFIMDSREEKENMKKNSKKVSIIYKWQKFEKIKLHTIEDTLGKENNSKLKKAIFPDNYYHMIFIDIYKQISII